MVAISSPAKVLVTGANGYLATWVVKKYLEAGYSVRGTVRSLSKSAFLKDQFAHYGDRFELVVVEDITKDGAFDEAVKDVDAIAHTASPFHFKATNPDGRSDCLWILILLGEQDVYRSHHPCRAGYHLDPELCIETWECPEAFDPHLFGRGGS
jgi:nucleoside-diphosphate-sugar epimerase